MQSIVLRRQTLILGISHTCVQRIIKCSENCCGGFGQPIVVAFVLCAGINHVTAQTHDPHCLIAASARWPRLW